MMAKNLKYWLKGLAVAAASMIIYAVALGCYIALMLLIISMEEGGDNLSAFSVPLTEAVVLLSQGSGFKTGSITLTIMPLLLTVMLIALISSLAKRIGTSFSGCVTGTIGWVLINIFFANSVDTELVDTTGMIIVKTAFVFILGYAIALIPGAPLTERADAVVAMLRDRLGPEPTIIGVGGIGTVEQARARLAAGANLLQGYTAFIYEGPLWPAKINRELAKG